MQEAAANKRQNPALAATPAGPEPAAAAAAAAPWSTCRLWDPTPIFANPESQQPTSNSQQQHGRATQFNSGHLQQAQGTAPADAERNAQPEDTVMSEAGDGEADDVEQGGSTSGCLGLSCGG